MLRFILRSALVFLSVVALASCDPTVPVEMDDAGMLRQFGEPCRTTEDCASGLCLRIPGSDRSVCTTPCTAGASLCPSGWGCIQPDGLDARVCGCASPRTENCTNGRDDDCNGRVDDCRTCDGVPVPEDSTEHCGACGRRCANGQECVSGACTCPLGTMLCGGNCLNVQSSTDNCGACGRRCSAGSTCVAGECTCADARATYCDGSCVDLQTDLANCGACNDACPIGATCSAGRCSCGAGRQVCGDRCVSTQVDTSHCGSCGVACAPGEACTDGLCACPGRSQRNCGAGCIDVYSDTTNCGVCGRTCRSGEVCSTGVCRCESGIVCHDVCVANDAMNCGACGVTCRSDQVCDGTACTCPVGTRECGGRCVAIDAMNCAGCGDVCATDQYCDPSSRTCLCTAFGETFCGAASGCVNPSTDPSNCGTCGRACSGTASCSSGICSCPWPQTYCEGVGCVSLSSDSANCGRCGNACASPLSCNSSSCSCPWPSTQCGSICANLQSDNANCGSCGNVCLGETTCSSYACRCPIAGQTSCGGVCHDFQTDENNCGGCGVTCTGSQVCTAGACSCPAPTGGTVTRLTTNAAVTRYLRVAATATSIGVLWREGTVALPGELWFQRIDFNGASLGAAIRVATLIRNDITNNFDLATNGTDWLFASSDGSSAMYQRIGADGALVGTPATFPAPATSVATAWSPIQGWVLVIGSSTEASMQFLGPTASTPTLPVRLGAGFGSQIDVASAPDGSLLVVHNAAASGAVMGQPVNADGSITSLARTVATFDYRINGLEWDGRSFVATMLRTSGSTYEQYVYRGATLADRVLVARQTGVASYFTALALRDRRLVLAWSYINMTGVPGNLWTARLVSPDAAVGAPTILTPAASISATTTVDALMPPAVAYVDDDHVVYAWADTRWGQTETYTMSASLGMCR